MRRQHRSRTRVILAMFVASAAVGGVYPGVASASYPSEEAHLEFLAQPTTAVKTQTISADPLNPDGPPIQVRLVDDDVVLTTLSSETMVTIAIGANPGGGILSGDTSRPVSDGVATFDDLSIDKAGLGYTLMATASEADGDTSAPFDIVDAGGVCGAGGCSHSTSVGSTTATLSSSSGQAGYTQFLALDVQGAALDCPGYEESSADTTFEVSVQGGTALVTIIILRSSLPASQRRLSASRVCYGSPKPFTPRRLTELVSVGGEYVGLLPECRQVKRVPPCVVSRSKTSTTFSITFSAPTGDPRGRR